jgi:hypothetical protein
MATSFSGGCACGALRYECEMDPVFSWNCHCRDCQRASGGIPSPRESEDLSKTGPGAYNCR